MGGERRPAATLEHVARAAAVSRATASRALTGSGPVSAPAAARVRAAADRLGYVADPVARALVSGRGTRLVVAVSGASPRVLEDAYLGRVVGSAAQECAGDGLGVALRHLPLARPAPVLAALAGDRTVAGVVLVNTTQAVLDAVPAALLGRVVSIGIGAPAVPAFDVDNAQGAAAVVGRLLAQGRRRPVMVTGPAWLPCARRPVEAFRAAVGAAGLPVRTVPGDFSAAAGRDGAAALLRRWPDTDAVYAVCDATALGVLAALRERGVQVPGDVAVAGFDDVALAGHSGPALTTATHPVERIAAAAARAALSGAAPGTGRLFGSQLVVRDSA